MVGRGFVPRNAALAGGSDENVFDPAIGSS
jgi:hypothetical protein